MKSRICVCILSLSIAVLSLSLGSCAGISESDISGEKSSEVSDRASNDLENNSADISENSNSEIDDSEPENSAAKIPEGNPTIYTAPEGVPIYTSEITKALDENGYTISADKITLDKDSEIFCDGFQYFREPSGITYNSYRNPEMFDENGFLGDEPEVKPFKRVYVGDEMCGMKLTNAVTHFTNYSDRGGTFGINHEITSYTGNIVEFEGMVTLEGFLYITQPNNYEPDGGRLEFTPIEDKLPLLSGDGDGPYTHSVANRFYCLSETHGLSLNQEKFPYTEISGMVKGDLALVRATISKFCYTNGGGRYAVLEDVEVLSDVIAHFDEES